MSLAIIVGHRTRKAKKFIVSFVKGSGNLDKTKKKKVYLKKLKRNQKVRDEGLDTFMYRYDSKSLEKFERYRMH